MSELRVATEKRNSTDSNHDSQPESRFVEMIIVLLHIVMAVFGFLVAVVGAAVAYYYKAAFILIGVLMLLGGGLGAVATFQRKWFYLFVVNCINTATCILVFIYCVIAGMIAFDVRDPIYKSVDASWETIRPELEKANFCRPPTAEPPESVPECATFYNWADIVQINSTDIRGIHLRGIGDPSSSEACPYSTDAMATNCSLAVECDTSAGQVAGRHGRNCFACTQQCKELMVEDMRGAVDDLNYIFYVIIFGIIGCMIFNVQLIAICKDVQDWNEYMELAARTSGKVDDFEEQRMQNTLLQKIGMICNGGICVFGFFIVGVAIYILSTQSDVYFEATVVVLVIGLALAATGCFLVFGTVQAAALLLRIGNWLLMVFTFILMMSSMFLSLCSGTIADIHKDIDDDWDEISAALTVSDPKYCRPGDTPLTDDECKDKFFEDLQAVVSVLFTFTLIAILSMWAMMFLTHGAMLKMYHESGGQLKNKIQGLTSHKRQLPEAQRNELLMSRRPELASAAENEAAVLELSDEEDDVDPKDAEAKQYLEEGDEALHEGDLETALKLYLKAQAIDHENPKLKSRVKHARQQKNIAAHLSRQIELYDEEHLQMDAAATKIQANFRGKKMRE